MARVINLNHCFSPLTGIVFISTIHIVKSTYPVHNPSFSPLTGIVFISTRRGQ